MEYGEHGARPLLDPPACPTCMDAFWGEGLGEEESLGCWPSPKNQQRDQRGTWGRLPKVLALLVVSPKLHTWQSFSWLVWYPGLDLGPRGARQTGESEPSL